MHKCVFGVRGRAGAPEEVVDTPADLREGGLARLLSGVEWRTANLVATVWIANEFLVRLPPYLMAFTRGRTER